MKNLGDFTDTFGFIVHHDTGGSGGGDSSQRTFSYAILQAAQKKGFSKDAIEQKANLLICHGDFRRHWDGNYWPGQEGYGSRDNFAPMMMALTLVDSPLRFEMMRRVRNRFGLLWNTKKIGQQGKGWKAPDFIGVLIPLIVNKKLDAAVWYMGHAQGVAHQIQTMDDPTDSSDDLNYQLALHTLDLLGANVYPTISDYCFNRPKLNQSDVKLGYQQAVVDYFASEIAPPLDVEYINASVARHWPQIPKGK